MQELWLWIERIGGGLASLLLLGLVLTYTPIVFRWLGRLLLRLLKAIWQLPSVLLALWRNPWACLQRWCEQSTLFTLAIFPLLWLLEKCSPSALPGRRSALTQSQSGSAMENSALPRVTTLPACVADRQGELTAHGIWALAQAVHGFCDKQRYPLWRFTHEKHNEAAIAAWQQSFIAALADWMEVRFWVEEYERDWGMSAQVHLSEREFLCCERRPRKPYRNLSTLELEPSSPRSESMRCSQIRLGELLQTRHGVDGLIYRLDKKNVAPYEAIDIPPLADEQAANRMLWTWNHKEAHPMTLAWPDLSGFQGGRDTPSPVLIPRAWGSVEKSFGWFGPLHLHGGNSMIVADESGCSGIVHLLDLNDPLLGDVVGYWMQPCVWRYLRGKLSSRPIFEATQSLEPDARGEVVCDLINGVSGERLNPPGIKILANTVLDEDCCIAVNEASDSNSPKHLDLMSLSGQLMHGQLDTSPPNEQHAGSPHELRWARLYSGHAYRPVQSRESGHWGFIDRHGAIIIEPRFARVSFFEQDLAPAWPTDTPTLVGLIDTKGDWAIPPRWKSIHPQTRRQFIVQNVDDQWGAVDEHGELVIALQPRATWLQDAWIAEKLATERAEFIQHFPWSKSLAEVEDDVLVEGIARQRHELVKRKVQTALTTPPYSLAALEGIFDRDPSSRDLHEAGIWGIRVQILDNQNEGILRAKAGETGHIATYYPVGLSCFDLSVEAPISSLASHPEAVVGIPWRNLAAVFDDQRERES